jgi:hypothetical protein
VFCQGRTMNRVAMGVKEIAHAGSHHCVTTPSGLGIPNCRPA